MGGRRRRDYLDTDEERLPEGMTRIGYDADTQVYTYRDSDGSLWEGAPGCRYGRLQRVPRSPPLPSVTVPRSSEGGPGAYVLYDSDSSSSSEFDDNDEKIEKDEKYGAGVDRRSGLRSAEQQKTTAGVVGDGTRQMQAQNDRAQTPLKRAGTLSRIARFLSTSSSPSASPSSTGGGGAAAAARRPSRRATVTTAAPRLDNNNYSNNNDRRQGGRGTGGAGQPLRRATTFDEILAGMDAGR